MKNMLPTYCIVFILAFLIFIPSVHAENKIVKITDNGSLYGGISPQSYYYNGEKEGIYVVYSRVDRLENNPNGDIDSFIRFYDFETDTVSEEYLVGRGHGDSHGAPTLCIDDRGYIHVFYGCHSDQLEYAMSTSPEEITSWTKRTDLLPNEFGYTYPKAVFANGTLNVFFRSRGHGGISVNQGKYACIQSNDYGKSWSKQREFVDASNNQYAISVYPTDLKYANGYFHVCWYLMLESGPHSNYYGPNSNETQYNAYYAKSSDGVTWFNAAESHASNHITMAEMDKFYQVYNTTNQTKIIGQHNDDYSFIRYRTTPPPKLAISNNGIPFVGLRPTDDGPVIRYWKNDRWNSIHLLENMSYTPTFVSKELSMIPVNALSYRRGNIYLSNYGYNSEEDELRIIGRDIYKWNEKTETFDFIHHYSGQSLIFKEVVVMQDSDEKSISKNYNNSGPIIQILMSLSDHIPILKSWFLNLLSKIEPFLMYNLK